MTTGQVSTYVESSSDDDDDDEGMSDFKEIGDATDLSDVIIAMIILYNSRCYNFCNCKQHLSTDDIDKGLEYCEKCTQTCIMPKCGKTFTPDDAGTFYTEGMCGDCSVCKYCGGIQEGPGCYCNDACGESGLVEEPPQHSRLNFYEENHKTSKLVATAYFM